MRMLAMVGALTLAVSAPVATAPSLASSGCPLFPADSVWHAGVSRLPAHPRSGAYLAAMGTGAGIHADFGSGTWEGGPIGIPYTVVPAGQARVPVRFGYAGESDPGPYPIPPDAPVEGGPDADGDRHVLVVQAATCRLYELFDAHREGDGWRAGSGAVWDLRSNRLRPAGWTSRKAAAARPVTARRWFQPEPRAVTAAGSAPAPAPSAGAGRAGAGDGGGALLPRVLTVVLGLTAAALATRAVRRPRQAPPGRHVRAPAPPDPERSSSRRR
jgi:hypothetical protein